MVVAWILMFALAIVHGEESPNTPPIASKVIVIDGATFDDVVGTAEDTPYLLLLTASWCKMCQELAPRWEETAKELEGEVHVASLDCDEHFPSRFRFDVKHYPDIRLIHKGLVYTLNYDHFVHKQEQLVAWAREGHKFIAASAIAPIPQHPYTAFKTKSLLDTLKADEQKPWLLEFYAPWCGACKSFSKQWNAIALELAGDASIGVGTVDVPANPGIDSIFGVGFYPTIKVVVGSPPDHKLYTFVSSAGSGKMVPDVDAPGVLAFAKGGWKEQGEDVAAAPPPDDDGPMYSADSSIVQVDDSNFDQLVLKASVPAFVEFYAPWCGHCKALAPVWRELADNLEGDVLIAAYNADEHQQVKDKLGVKGFPTLKFFAQGKTWPYGGGRDYQSLHDFASGGYADQAADPSEDDIVELTSATFDAQLAAGRWLIMFYAPGCGWCRKLMPTMLQTAAMFLDDPDVHVARLDGKKHGDTAGRFQPLGLKGFPAVYLIEEGKVWEYRGNRTLDDLVDFAHLAHLTPHFRPLPPALTALDRWTRKLDLLVFQGAHAAHRVVAPLLGLESTTLSDDALLALVLGVCVAFGGVCLLVMCCVSRSKAKQQ